MNVTREQAQKVLEVMDKGLTPGLGVPEPGKMCVEAAICYALDLPHGDDPGCVSAAVRAFKISLNDKQWSSNEARAKGLRALAIAQLGSKGVIDDPEFLRRLAEETIRQIVPIALRAAARRVPSRAVALEDAALACEREGTRASALRARDAAAYAAYAAAAAAAAYAADAAAYGPVTPVSPRPVPMSDEKNDARFGACAADAAAYAAYAAAAAAAAYAADARAYAADAAGYAAYAAAAAVAYAADAAAAAAYAADARDSIFAKAASLAFDVLREMQAPGVALWDEVNA